VEYINNGVLLSHKEWYEGKWMQVEDIRLSEVRLRKTECFLSYMEGRSYR
jgi:hypothetical protein